MNYGLREKYEQLKKFDDRLSGVMDIIDWDQIKPLFSDLYVNDMEKNGRPNYDPVKIIKIPPFSNGTDYRVSRLKKRSGIAYH